MKPILDKVYSVDGDFTGVSIWDQNRTKSVFVPLHEIGSVATELEVIWDNAWLNEDAKGWRN